MNQSNYDNYNFDHYQHPRARKGFLEKVIGPGLAAKFRNPLFATTALLITGAAFAGIIIASYPDSNDGQNIPVIQAETTAFKGQPDDPGGMDVPFQDSTVFSGMRDDNLPEPAPVENLLDSEEPVDRLEAFAAEAEKIIQESEARQKTLNLIEDATGVQAIEAHDEATPPAEMASAEPQTIKQEVVKIKPEDLMQQVQKPSAAKPVEGYKAGTSPDTLEYVKNVLDKKDGKVADDTAASPMDTALNTIPEEEARAAAARVAAVKPAAGTAAAVAVSEGTHYIQLGSVKTSDGAAAEWGKLQKKYPAQLSSLQYRVQRADLGERGVFYRIQAGPISGESAGSLCDSIKAQSPGACLVTK